MRWTGSVGMFGASSHPSGRLKLPLYQLSPETMGISISAPQSQYPIKTALITAILTGSSQPLPLLRRWSHHLPVLTELRPGRFTVYCSKCKAHSVEFSAATRDEAIKILNRDGWDDRAVRGKARESWTWICPTCAPPESKLQPRSAHTDPIGEGGFIRPSDVEDPRMKELLEDTIDTLKKT